MLLILLDKADLLTTDHPVGVESPVQDAIQLLNSQQSKDSLLIGILGMGKIGKTTIAKVAYNKKLDCRLHTCQIYETTIIFYPIVCDVVIEKINNNYSETRCE